MLCWFPYFRLNNNIIILWYNETWGVWMGVVVFGRNKTVVYTENRGFQRMCSTVCYCQVRFTGWGWMCVFGQSINALVRTLLVHAFGVTYLQLLKHYDCSPAAVAWVGALSITCSGIFGKTQSLCVTNVRSVTGMQLFIGPDTSDVVQSMKKWLYPWGVTTYPWSR